MPNIFNSVKLPGIRSNKFDLSHDVKMSFQMGRLVPSCVMDVLPGDVFNMSTQTMLRFAPLVSPVMHRINVTTHFYFVPNRLLWSGWENFITEESQEEHPFFTPGNGYTDGSIGSYLGYPTGVAATQKLNPFPLLAYNLIWNEYYRDQDLQSEILAQAVAGDNSGLDTVIGSFPQPRAWNHDYFTSARPFAQKGDEVEIPLINGGSVDVGLSGINAAGQVRKALDGNLTSNLRDLQHDQFGNFQDSVQDLFYDPNGTLDVDLQSDATTVTDLRNAFRMQEFLERDARGGTRYKEHILSHFGVVSPDKRLDRPEYIGGSRQNMVISEVLSTAQTDPSGSQEIPVGYLGGHGISAGSSGNMNYRATEHGWIIGIVNVQPVTGYFQGVPRSHQRLDKFDYYWPSFAHVGEQAIKTSEIYCVDGMNQTELDATFGYAPRYSEYKYQQNRVAGKMRSDLKFWHLAREFSSIPTLSSAFVSCNPSGRIFAVPENEDHIYAHVFNKVNALRRMPVYGNPSI